MTRLLLPYGAIPLRVELPDLQTVCLEAAPSGGGVELGSALEEALAHPVGAPPVEAIVGEGGRVLLIVSDRSRTEPRAQMLRAVRRRLPASARLTLAVANGTHAPGPIEDLGLDSDLLAGVEIVNHDGHDDRDLVVVGTTSRGTPVRVHRCALECEVIIALGIIKPHYFAGFGAGVKALFPGLGGNREIRKNHELKRAPGAVAGRVEDNPCRLDLEEAAGLVGTPMVVLNLVTAPDGAILGAVYGDAVAAFRVGAARSLAAHRVVSRRFPTVIASDALPVSGSLYQASKIVAAVAPILADGGTIILVSECSEGVEPTTVVNELIYRLGLVPRLPERHVIRLVSALPAEVVRQSYCEPAASIQDALQTCGTPIAVVPRASSLIFEGSGAA